MGLGKGGSLFLHISTFTHLSINEEPGTHYSCEPHSIWTMNTLLEDSSVLKMTQQILSYLGKL